MNPKIYKNLIFSHFIAIFLVFVISGCSSLDIVPNKTDRFKEMQEAKGNGPVESMPLADRFKKIFDENSGMSFSKSITYEVALKQFSIMPLISIDRNSGAIITDWYSTNSNKNERVKFNIFILDENMNSDSVSIIMFKETFNGSNWISSVANKKTSIQIKELILKKARQLKAASELS
jgi:hypothetical protein